MGTRSNIGIMNEDGATCRVIYCHWDGYPDRNGRLLAAHYSSTGQVEALIALGALSSLGGRVAPSAGESHSFSSPAHGVTVAYHRDRGEEMLSADTRALGNACQEEYAYIWKPESNAWIFSDHGDAFRPLVDVLARPGK